MNWFKYVGIILLLWLAQSVLSSFCVYSREACSFICFIVVSAAMRRRIFAIISILFYPFDSLCLLRTDIYWKMWTIAVVSTRYRLPGWLVGWSQNHQFNMNVCVHCGRYFRSSLLIRKLFRLENVSHFECEISHHTIMKFHLSMKIARLMNVMKMLSDWSCLNNNHQLIYAAINWWKWLR